MKIGAFGLSLILTTGGVMALFSSTNAANAVPVVEDCFACFWEVCNPQGGQHWDDGTEGSKSGTKHTDCDDGDGDCHGACGGTLAPTVLIQVLAAYDRGDLEALERIATSNGEFIYLNEDRGALQVDGCNGELQANLPLSLAQFDRLSAALARH
jgi:hypothetical protein